MAAQGRKRRRDDGASPRFDVYHATPASLSASTRTAGTAAEQEEGNAASEKIKGRSREDRILADI